MRVTKGLVLSAPVALFIISCNGIIGTRDNITFEADAASTTADGAPAQSCNADLQTDKNNCGGCGQDCSNGNCADGVCTLVDQQFGAAGIDINSGTLYVAVEDGHVVSCPTNGCSGGATILYTSKINPNVSPDEPELAPTRIHFSNGSTPTLYVSNNKDNDVDGFGGDLTTGVYSIHSGAATRATPTNQTWNLEFNVSLDGTTLYWGSQSDNAGEPSTGTFTCTIGNCTTTEKTIDTSDDLYDSIFLPNGAFVWASDSGVHYCDAPPACSGATKLFNPGAPNAWPQALAFDDKTNLLLISVAHSSNQGADTVVSCPATDAACNPTNVATGLFLPRGLAAGGGFVYVAETGTIDTSGSTIPTDGKIEKYPINADGSGGTAVVIAKNLPAPNRITIDSQSVYWTTEGIFGDISQPGAIMKGPR